MAGVNGVQCNGSAIAGMQPGQPHLLQGFQRLLSHLLFQQECCLRGAQYSTGNCKENKCWSQCIHSISVTALNVPVHKSSLRSCWICFRLFRWLSLKMQQIMRKYKRCTDGFVTWMMFVCGGSRRGLREECLCFHPMMPGMGHGVADTALVWG